METPNYLEIVITGYCERGSYFKDYLIGKIKEYEKVNISKIEFVEKIGNEIDACINDINVRYDKYLKRYDKDILKKKKDRYGYPKPYKYKEEVENDENPNIICLSTTTLTNGAVKKMQYLYLIDFEKMRNIVYELYGDEVEIKKNVSANHTETSHKTQILLLQKLGFFDLEVVDNLTTEKKGLLVSLLLNRNKDNTIDYIGNRYEKGDYGSKKSPYNQNSQKQLEEILAQLNILK